MKRILPVIVISQFFCTSSWFAGNAVMSDILKKFHLAPDFLAHLTSAIQFGFITGTLVFAVLAIADRFSPSRVFFVCSIIAGLCNLGITIDSIQSSGILLFRFFTGFFLAGIYPVGMKIASDYYQKGLGKSLGFLVGALVIGTAFPHLLKSAATHFSWKYIIFSTSAFSALGGTAMLTMVPDGPFRKQSQKPNFTAFLKGFKNKNFRAASFGYFGHMWELYTFWAFIPVILTTYNNHFPVAGLNVPLFSFMIIASGGISCALGGLLSQKFGAKKIATGALFSSCCCCFLSPLFLLNNSEVLLIIFLFFWGLMATADSPLFSTLIARNASEESRGTSLTIVNCIGFAITIVSIQVLSSLSGSINIQYIFMILGIGPVLGLIALFKNKTEPVQ